MGSDAQHDAKREVGRQAEPSQAAGSPPRSAMPDYRAAAEAQRVLRSLAETAPRAQALQALQTMANRYAKDRAPPALAPGGPVQLIRAKVEGYQDKKVRHGKQVGVIKTFKGPKYQVDFGTGPRPDLKWVKAEDLAAEGWTEPAEKADVDSDVEDVGEPSSSTAIPEPKQEQEELSTTQVQTELWGVVPTQLELAPTPVTDDPDDEATPRKAAPRKKAKATTWDLILRDKSGTEIARVSGIMENQVKDYVERKNRITTEPKPVKAGPPLALKTPPLLVGVLAQAYVREMQRRQAREQYRVKRETLAATAIGDVPALDQAGVMKRLRDLGSQKDRSETGDNRVVMTKIKLSRVVKLKVGGIEREITHLYTQAGSPTEIRCYLGTANGAYQRVHTSLTEPSGAKKEAHTSHTMVQTSETVATPGSGRTANRVGFDAEETKASGKSLAARDLDRRSAKQCNVEDWLVADDWTKMDEAQREGCYMLAREFNAALDKVLADAGRGELNDWEVGRSAEGFKTLDDSWLFASGRAATPGAEWTSRQQDKATATLDGGGTPGNAGLRPQADADVPEMTNRVRARMQAVDPGAYEKHIAFIRQGVGEPVAQDNVKGVVYPGYELSAEQIAALGDRTLLPTVPDGDCSLNAVLESLGETASLNELRAEIANRALDDDNAADGRAAEDILQPGAWQHSDIMLAQLAQLLSLQIIIIQPGGQRSPPIGPGDPDRGQVVLVHVDGAVGHFYGTRA